MNPIRQAAKLSFNSLCAAASLARIKLSRSPSLVILTYHRVLPQSDSARQAEQPGMVISPEAFNRHLALMKALGATFVSLKDWLDAAESGSALPRFAVAVTFDDGWRDNYQHAYPILKKYQVPATIFLVSRRINTDWQFWPEQVLNLLINHTDKLDHPSLAWLTPYMTQLNKKPSQPLTLDQADSVIQSLKTLDDKSIEDHLAQTRSALPEIAPKGSDRPLLNDKELEEMNASGLVTYGAHTQHHYRLNRLSNSDQLEQEIVISQKDLEEKGLNPVPIFCYPNGDISSLGEQLVTQHYQAACTTLRGWNHSPAQPFGLKRFNFHDGNGGSTLSFLATLGRPG